MLREVLQSGSNHRLPAAAAPGAPDSPAELTEAVAGLASAMEDAAAARARLFAFDLLKAVKASMRSVALVAAAVSLGVAAWVLCAAGLGAWIAERMGMTGALLVLGVLHAVAALAALGIRAVLKARTAKHAVSP